MNVHKNARLTPSGRVLLVHRIEQAGLWPRSRSEWGAAHSGDEINIAALAERAGLETRAFLRRFQKATGQKPTKYVQALRIGVARERLEFSRDTVERIAWNAGYKDDPRRFAGCFRR